MTLGTQGHATCVAEAVKRVCMIRELDLIRRQDSNCTKVCLAEGLLDHSFDLQCKAQLPRGCGCACHDKICLRHYGSAV